MKLLASGAWRVLALVDERGRCETEEMLQNHPLGDKLGNLLEAVAARGPRSLGSLARPNHLGEGIFEFRRRPAAGAQVRLLWFYGGTRSVICTHAFSKAKAKTPAGELERAKRLRDRYLSARRGGER